MRELSEKLLALVLILLLGALSQKRLRLPESFYQSANDLVIRVTLPAMILCSMDKSFSPETLRVSIQLLLIAVCAFAAVIVGLELWRKFSKRPPKELGLYQYLILVGNTAFMGYPVIQRCYLKFKQDTETFFLGLWHNRSKNQEKGQNGYEPFL